MKLSLVVLVGLVAVAGNARAQATLKTSPTAAAFTYQLGDAKLPAVVSLSITVSGSTSPVALSVTSAGGAWLSASPDTGRTPLTVKVSVNPTGLPLGAYTGSVTITPGSVGMTPFTVPVTLTLKAPPATLTVTPNPLTVAFTRGDPGVSTQFLSVSGNGGLMSYTAAVSGASWLSVTPANGIIFPGFMSTLSVSIDPSGLAPGTFKGTINVGAPTASNKTQAVPVILTVNPGLPVLYTIWPMRNVAGSGATTVTLNGANFYSGSLVVANSSALATTYLGSNSMQAVLPPSMMSTAGTVNLVVSNPSPGGGDSQPAAFTILPAGPQILGITDGASFIPGSVAPGEMVAVFGSGIGPDVLTTFALPIPPATTLATSLAGVRMLFNDVPASLIFVSATQLVAMIPYNTPPTSIINAIAEYNGVQSAAYPLAVVDSVPSLFTLGSVGTGQAAAFNVDETTGALSLNSDTAPVIKGGVISLFGTGAGLTNPSGVDGSILGSPAAGPVVPVTAKIDNQDATVLYAGGAPGLVDGMFQINLRVPVGATAGKAIPIIVTMGAASSPVGVTIGVK
ncbi:MAG: IPT/TIG domain-containing protein [Bryobacteraceae bacterium]